MNPTKRPFDWVPTPEIVANSNLTAFIRKTGEPDLAALSRHADADPAWLMQQVFEFCDFRFYEPPQQMLDTSRGIEWARWCVGGTTNVVLNCIDRHRDTPAWERPFLVWEGEDRRAQRNLTYRDFDAEVCRLAGALQALGVQRGDRVGLYMPNLPETFIAFFAVMKVGAVVMPLFSGFGPQPLVARLNDGEAKVVLTVDGTWRRGTPGSMKAVLDEALQSTPSVEHVLVLRHLGDALACPMTPDRDHDWAAAVARQASELPTAEMQADDAAVLLYTSGTTGNPKGAVYSHRSTVLHAYAAALPDAMDCSSRDVILPVVPMFHVNAWGLPYSAAIVGCKFVLPGPHLDGKSLYELFESEKVNFSAGVPTVWLGLLNYVKANNLKFSTFKRTVIGGSACPPAMMKSLQQDYGIEVIHAWGMTEMSPLGTLSKLTTRQLDLPPEAQQRLLEKQGRVVYGVDMAIIDDEGRSLPWDGQSSGNLVVRGHWVISRYFNHDESPLVSVDGEPGWFPTGDVATIDADGFMQITDRSKDVIKSGGEWISSIDLENIAMAHPAVNEAAVIAAKHPKWDERPLLVVVKKPEASVTREELLAFYEGRIAKWQIPDDIVFVAEIPHTATGKVQKLKLREQFLSHQLPTI